MKKLYTLATAVATAMTLNAQLYVVGSGSIGGTALAWDPAAPYTVEASSEGYVFDLTSDAGIKISNAYGDWNTFNGGARYASLTEANIGTAVALTASDQDILFPWQGVWHCVVASDLSTITVTTTTEKPTGNAEVWIRGDMNEWATNDAWKFQTEDGVTYTLHCTIAAGVSFKIADGSWGAIDYGCGNITLDEQGVNESTWTLKGANSVMVADFTGTVSFTLPAGADGLAVKFVSDVAPQPGGYTEVWIRGDMNEWATNDAWKFQTEDGVNYTISCTIAAGIGFKIADASYTTVNYSIATPITVENTWSGTWGFNLAENASFATDFTGTIAFTLPAGADGLAVTLTRTSVDAIDSIAADAEAPAAVYNLQGIRVDRPAKGLYIINGKKVLVR